MIHMRLLTAAAAALAAFGAKATINLPAIYSSNMVLQQNSTVTVNGTATANYDIKFKGSWGEEVNTTADADGNFTLKINVPAATGRPLALRFYEMKNGVNKGSKILSSVYAGEVWICSGQSNMEMATAWDWSGTINNSAWEVQDANNYPLIKIVKAQLRGDSPEPCETPTLAIPWSSCSANTIKDFSALGYLFGKQLYKTLRVPIGLIESAYGGSSVQAWIDRPTAEGISGLSGNVAKCEAQGYRLADIQAANNNWATQQIPTLLYNSMLYQFHNLPARGVIWYQGENEAWGCPWYVEAMNKLIQNWRDTWGSDLAFYTVQLAGFYGVNTNQPNSNWAALRWDQYQTSIQVSNSGMATAVDIGNQNDIHPKNKQEVARRLALQALNKTYGKDVICEAPMPAGQKVEFRKTTLRFNDSIYVRNDSVPVGFLFKDRTTGSFYIPDATLLDDHTLQLSVTRPLRSAAIYYNWADYPLRNIYGKNALPVLPFRTDKMKLVNDLVGIQPALSVEDDGVAPADAKIYDADGKYLGRGRKVMERLRKGVYIQDGKKKLIK